MGECKFYAPTAVDDALALLAEHGDNITVLAGGTDLLPRINHYDLKVTHILYLDGLGLGYVKEKDGTLIIGAATKTAEIAENALISEKASALAKAAQISGSATIRNAATIGGNIVNASPGADLVPPLTVMKAELHLKSKGGDRIVPITEFSTGAKSTVMQKDEILTEIHIPPYKGTTSFIKLGRRKAMTLSVVNAAACIEMNGENCKEARIAIGCVGPTVLLCDKASNMLEGQALNEELIQAAALDAIGTSSPIDDQRATAWYRKKAGKTVVYRALMEAAKINIE